MAVTAYTHDWSFAADIDDGSREAGDCAPPPPWPGMAKEPSTGEGYYTSGRALVDALVDQEMAGRRLGKRKVKHPQPTAEDVRNLTEEIDRSAHSRGSIARHMGYKSASTVTNRLRGVERWRPGEVDAIRRLLSTPSGD
jgi:hypothetical protein